MMRWDCLELESSRPFESVSIQKRRALLYGKGHNNFAKAQHALALRERLRAGQAPRAVTMPQRPGGGRASTVGELKE
eukprot:5631352-Prymnesium_polylepis.1